MNGSEQAARTVLACAIVATGILTLGCGSPPDPGAERPPDRVADIEAVLAAHDAMVQAYGQADLAAFSAMLDRSSKFLLFHPMTQSRYESEELESGAYAAMFELLRDSHWTDVHLAVDVSGDAAWITSHVLIESGQLPMPFVGRGTEVWVRTADGWKLRHGHWSENPEDYP